MLSGGDDTNDLAAVHGDHLGGKALRDRRVQRDPQRGVDAGSELVGIKVIEMSVYLYSGGERIVGRSGVGQAIAHQRGALRAAGLPPDERMDSGTRVVHINTVLPDSPVMALMARARGKKVVYYAHSTMEDFRCSFRGSNLLAPLFKQWIRFCYRQGDVILTPTAYSEELLRGYALKKPIYHISNGIDTEFFRPSPEKRAAFRKTYGLAERETAVISVGHLMERKGILDYIELARQMPQVRFFWFGYTDPKLIPAPVQQAIDGAPENLTFAGFVDQEALRDAYCGADAFAFLSHEETEGIVVLEALACGTPTLLRDIPVYDNWLESGKNVYKADSLEGFRKTLTAMLDGTLPDLTDAGREVARSRSLAAVGERLREIYQSEGLLDTHKSKFAWTRKTYSRP